MPGIPGEKGDRGRMGLSGDKGSPGHEGQPGEEGPIGLTGHPGELGPRGFGGPRGFPGIQGKHFKFKSCNGRKNIICFKEMLDYLELRDLWVPKVMMVHKVNPDSQDNLDHQEP